MSAYLSVIITAKNRNDPKLKDLEFSLSLQTFRNFETIIVAEGNSETAKAIGLKRTKGSIVCILASDNYLNDLQFFEKCLKPFEDKKVVGSFPLRYWYYKNDDILNRYFALFGVNDPIPLYLKKNDRASYYVDEICEYPIIFTYSYPEYFIVKLNSVPTLGDNGFFIRRNILMQADIDHYFHIDVCQDLFDLGYKTYAIVNTSIWHRTGGNIIKFFLKRLKYADKFSQGRRWKMVTKKDLPRLCWFVFSTLMFIYPLYLSIKGYRKVKDIAWFLHPLVCLITLGVYGIWTIKKILNVRLLFVQLIAQKV